MIKNFFIAVVVSVAACIAASFLPNSDAGMVTVSIDGNSLQNLFSVYENTGYHDFGTVKKLSIIEEIKTINEYYFEDWNIDLSGNDLKFEMDGVLDADARKVVGIIPFHPHVKTSGISAAANAFFKDFGLSSDGRIHLSICISDADVDISDISYGYGYIFNKLIIEGILDVDDIINSNAQAAVDNALVGLTDATNCIDITNQVAVGFPEFTELMDISHAGTKVEENKILVYGCPVEKTMIGEVVAVSDQPCGTVAYNIYVYTAGDIDYAGTDSKIKVSFCGDDVSGNPKCLIKDLNDWTEKGQISHLLIESSAVIVKNLSLTLESDNVGKKSGWYVDSVAVDMTIPNNKKFHYWFPIHAWIGGDDAPASYTFKQDDNLQVYTFEVKTGDASNFDGAGTNSNIVAELCDVNNKCLMFDLDKDGHDDFERGSVSGYTIVTKEKLSNAKSLTLHNAYSGEVPYGWREHPELYKHPGWYVQDVLYKHYSFPENVDHSSKDGQAFMFRQWLAVDKETYNNPPNISSTQLHPINNSAIDANIDISAQRYVNSTYGYNVMIKTMDIDGAGTDADILLTLEGCSGEKENFLLNDDRNNFEKGNVDVFLLSSTKNLNGLKKITLSNNGDGPDPKWSPEYIAIIPESYRGSDKDLYEINAETSEETAIYNKPYTHSFSTDIVAKGLWTSSEGELQCPDNEISSLKPFNYDVSPGDYVQIVGKNLNKAQNIEIILNKNIKPVLISRDYVLVHIPEETPLGDYIGDIVEGQAVGSVLIDGLTQLVYIHVRGEKPILDGIAITSAEPSEAFEVSMRNISTSSKFFLGDILLDVVSLSKKGVFLQIPRNMENGTYKFRTESNGWNITYDESIEIVKSIVPHVSSVSETIVYSGQVLNIYGKNFGDDLKSVRVMFGNKEAKVKSLDNEKIAIWVPSGIAGMNIAIHVSREDIPAPEVLTVEIKGLPWFMSFDGTDQLWTCDNAELSYDNAVKYGNSGYSLKIHGDGYKSIVSPMFNTYELGVISKELLLDVWIPEDQINPYWCGDVQISVNIPAAGLYNAWIGQALLTGLHSGWNTLSFELNQDVYNAFAGDFPNATITIILNTNQNTDDFRIDNMRFGGDVVKRTTEHVVGHVLDVYSAEFMSFDNINDWTVEEQELLFVETPKTQGLGATGVVASGYTEMKSRTFAPSELKNLSNVVSLDIYVPNPQPNNYWVGDIGLSLNCPDLGINSMYLGNVNLTHLFRNQFNTIQFTITEKIMGKLRYGVGTCSFSIYLNVGNGAGLFLFDNMGFVNILEVASRY